MDDTPVTQPRGDYAERWTHIERRVLIRATKDFIVFIDPQNDLDWETSQAYDAEQEQAPDYKAAEENSILNDAAELETSPCSEIADGVRDQFKRLIGEALVCCLSRDYAAAGRMIGVARRYIDARSRETSRYWYLTASFLTTAPFVVVGFILWLARDYFMEVLTPAGLWAGIAATLGAVGALFSVIVRSGNLSVDCSAGRSLHNLEAGSRICAGAIAGFLAGIAVKSGFILAPLIQSGHLYDFTLMAALAAGSGERLAGSIISSLESPENEVKKSADEPKGEGSE